MSIIHSMSRRASRVAGEVQQSIRRARLEGERRLLERQHRAALEDLGTRAYDLVQEGAIPADLLGPEVAAVEGRLMEIDAKATEMGRGDSDADTTDTDGQRRGADLAFPMLADGRGDSGAAASDEDPPA